MLIPNLSWGSENEDDLSNNALKRLLGNKIETTNLCEWLEKEIDQNTELMNSQLENSNFEIDENDLRKLSDKIIIFDYHGCSESLFMKILLEENEN